MPGHSQQTGGATQSHLPWATRRHWVPGGRLGGHVPVHPFAAESKWQGGGGLVVVVVVDGVVVVVWQWHGTSASGRHSSPALGQKPLQVPSACCAHGISHRQALSVGMNTHWSPEPGGQSPVHIGAVPGWAPLWHGIVVVVLVVVVGTVVVVPMTVFRTGVQRSRGGPTKVVSWSNWSCRSTWIAPFTNFVVVEQSTGVPPASVHVFTPIL